MFRAVNSVLKKVFKVEVKKSHALLVEKQYYEGIANGAIEFYRIKAASGNKYYNDSIAGLGFSKDRPLQLYALLQSYFKLVANAAPLVIIYKASNEQINEFYQELAAAFAGHPVRLIAETNLHEQVLNWVEQQCADRVFFLTDDAIFLEEMDLNDCLSFDPVNEIFVFRFGRDLTYSFTFDQSQQLPDFEMVTGNNGKTFLKWDWGTMLVSPDWSYPLSVDGHMYYRAELLAALRNIQFKNPNTLEANIQVFRNFFLCRKGVCYEKAKMINIPCNLVQSEFVNRSTGYFTVDELLDIWAKKQKIAISDFYKVTANEAFYKKYTFLDR